MRLLIVPLVVLLAACAETPPQGEAGGLVGPTWQLVSFKGGDGRVEMPVERS